MIDPNRLRRGQLNEIAPGVWYLPALMANVYFIGERGGPWVLVDAGVRGTAWRITQAAAETFGSRPPEAVVLTHGHFDHVGALPALLRDWDVPVYAHALEMPYLTGRSDYPPPDPTVGGFMAQLSRFFPNSGSNLPGRVIALDNQVYLPAIEGWRWLHTPGHTPGHISLFRDSDRCLIAGDAVITIDQDHASMLARQKRVVRRPPSYLTQDWGAAAVSVQRLAELRPYVLATGHGLPMAGDEVAGKLEHLARNFKPPCHGRYVNQPVRADTGGTVWLPPPVHDPVPGYLVGAAAAAVLVGFGISRARR